MSNNKKDALLSKIESRKGHKKLMLHAFVPMNVGNNNSNQDRTPKSVVFGTDTRTMWSSQSQKRPIKDQMFFSEYLDTIDVDKTSPKERMDELSKGKFNIAVPMKSAMLASIFNDVFKANGYSDEDSIKGSEEIANLIGSLTRKTEEKAGTEDKKVDETEDETDNETGNETKEKSKKESMTTLTIQEYIDLQELILEHSKNKSLPTKEELIKVFMKKVPDRVSALFGRFIAGLNRSLIQESAIAVASAVSINPAGPNRGHFEKQLITAMDRISNSTGHMDSASYSAPIMYKNCDIDMDLIEKTLGGDEDAKIITKLQVQEFIKNFLMIQPTGMSKAYASYAYASYAMIEKGTGHPRTLIDSFTIPTNTLEKGVHLIERMKTDLDRAYTATGIPKWDTAVWHAKGDALKSNLKDAKECPTLQDLLDWVVE